jgi:hypothetical protein
LPQLVLLLCLADAVRVLGWAQHLLQALLGLQLARPLQDEWNGKDQMTATGCHESLPAWGDMATKHAFDACSNPLTQCLTS